MFAVYDSKAKCFYAPFTSQNAATAIRNFSQAVNAQGGDTQIAKHPEDFTLFKIGEFDDELGTLQRLDQLENLGLAANFKVNVRLVQPGED